MQYTCNFIATGNIGCVTTARTTPVSPVLNSRRIFSGGVRPVGQITSSSGERPPSPSFAASTATRVSEQSTQQRLGYFSTFAGEAVCGKIKVMNTLAQTHVLAKPHFQPLVQGRKQSLLQEGEQLRLL